MILTRYVLKEHIAPFFYALFIITFLFMVDFLIRILSSILSKGLELWVVLEIIVLNMAWMLALSIPMAVLVSTLMAFGRLAADNEITAMKATGIPPLKILFPVMIVGMLLTGFLIYFNNYILPEANHRAASLRTDIGRKKPTALISPRTLIKDFENYQLWIDRLNPESGLMRGVQIYTLENGKPLKYTFADSATMEYARDGKVLLVHLHQGENHVLDHQNRDQYVRIRFRSQTVSIDNVDAALERHERSYRSDREMSIQDMHRIVQGSRARSEELRKEYSAKIFDEMGMLSTVLEADSIREVPPRLVQLKWWESNPIPSPTLALAVKQEKDKLYLIERFERRIENENLEIAKFMVEIHKKFSIPFACLIFIMIGAPLGVMARRGGIGTGSVYSLIVFVIYWMGLIRGEVLADGLTLKPWVAMWGPNLLVGCIGIFLLWRMTRENYLAPGIPIPWLRKRLASRKANDPSQSTSAAS